MWLRWGRLSGGYAESADAQRLGKGQWPACRMRLEKGSDRRFELKLSAGWLPWNCLGGRLFTMAYPIV